MSKQAKQKGGLAAQLAGMALALSTVAPMAGCSSGQQDAASSQTSAQRPANPCAGDAASRRPSNPCAGT